MLLLDALRHHALTRPDAPALTWLDDGERPRPTWTYRELGLRLHGAAEAIRAVVRPGDRVLVVAPEGPEQTLGILACVLAHAVAVPLHLPDGPRAADLQAKLRSVADDTEPSLLLTVSHTRNAATAPLGATRFTGLPVLPLDTLPVATDVFDPAPREDDAVAWLQYTSGSTGHPKGVRVAHGPLVRNLRGFDAGLDHRPEGALCTWLPGVHDLGIVYGLVLPLYIGMHAVRMAPADFVARPARWLQAMSRYRATHTASPDFGYAYAAKRVPDEVVATLDLSSLRSLVNAAEPIRRASEEAFLERFAPAGLRRKVFCHAYGMSEAVCVITHDTPGPPTAHRMLDRAALEDGRLASPEGERHQEVAANGRPIPGLELTIVDPDTRARLGPDRVGEVWVRGDTIGLGYRGRAEAADDAFSAMAADGTGPWMRTGDLGAVGEDGLLYVTGRAKDVLIVRGANHHAEDLEHTLEPSHPALRPGASVALPWEHDGAESVGVVAEVRPDGLQAEAVVTAIRQALSHGHGVAPSLVVLVPPRGVPKTSSGKRQRRETARRLRSGSLEVLHRWEAEAVAIDPGQDLEAFLRAHLAAALSVPPDAVPADTPLRELGLDSLQLMELAEALSRRLGRSVPPSDLFAHPTLAALLAAYAPSRSAVDDDLLAAIRAELDALD